ncbi:DNA repair protein crb2 [Podospora aff. communis PSN243]|uniref:DNA repair protein crb2 n=1 Tax=Podospora aff. communis PSN243 TaxID=3040156 RepID=A0AAV9GUC9_9PEZI|nr:DNA repair protein crb2 [Podospora aff. communis PSN243]
MMPPPSRTLRQAEKRALESAADSQDSQEVLEAYIMYSAGLMSSSPPPGESIALPIPKQIASLKNTTTYQRTAAASGSSPNLPSLARRTRDVNDFDDAHHGLISPVSDGRDATPHEALLKPSRRRDAAKQARAVDARVAESSAHSGEGLGASRRKPRKMDRSQSPTQSNGDRSSYGRYDQSFRPSSPIPRPLEDGEHDHAKASQTSAHEEKTLCEDDTGAVRFDFDADGTAKTGSSILEQSSVVDLGSLDRSQKMATNNPFAAQALQFPETPAHTAHNPFRHGRSQVLPTSQLFRATQFSSAVKLASPTSSRPSPNDFHQQNSISPNPPAVVSSPLKARGLRSTPPAMTSSPQVLPGTTSTEHNAPSSPLGVMSSKSPVIPDSQSPRIQRMRSAPQPMATYEPMRKSQERRSTSEVPPATASLAEDDEDDDDDTIARKRKARARKEAALSRMTAISFPRNTKPDDVEVPSTTNGKREAQAAAYLAQCHGSEETESEGEEEIADSQKLPRPGQKTVPADEESTQSDVDDHIAAEPDSIPDTAPDVLAAPGSPLLVATQLITVDERADAIPETSPPPIRQEACDATRPSSSDLPLVPAEVKGQGAKEAQTETKNRVTKAKEVETKLEKTPNFRSSPPAFSTRSRRAHASLGSTSSLSNLPSTPSISSSATPGTHLLSAVNNVSASNSVISDSSPAPAKGKPRGPVGRLAKLNTGSKESLKVPARRGRRLSSSTDELSRSSTTTPTFEPSIRNSRLSLTKSVRTSSKAPSIQRGPKIFEGMAFAISFQSKRPGETNDQYNNRVEFATTIEKRIKQAGGRILEAGFDELFDITPVKTATGSPSSSVQGEAELHLTDSGRSTGFTALIADGHSRKVKYMQALALGLPCLAGRWITSCLERGEIVDWTPYLLCAGQSAFLGDAIRSRSLTSYDAATARLEDIINQRTKLLGGSRILLVMKKALEGKKMAYVFLARILGASVSRVYSTEEARVKVKAEEDAGTPFNWVYVDGKEDAGDLFATPGTGGGRKRKRASAAASTATIEPPLKKIRTLSDELVIQSLILGRLIEEGEMEE